MAHWIGSASDPMVIFKDFREGRFVSVIYNVRTRQEVRTIPCSIRAVSPYGMKAVSINFARPQITRPDYGYPGLGQDLHEGITFPEEMPSGSNKPIGEGDVDVSRAPSGVYP